MEQLPSYVVAADSNLVEVKITGEQDETFLKSIGFKQGPVPEHFLFICDDEKAKGALLMKLRDHGFCFSYGKEWNPADVFSYLREKGLTQGLFKKIAWTGKDQFSIHEE